MAAERFLHLHDRRPNGEVPWSFDGSDGMLDENNEETQFHFAADFDTWLVAQRYIARAAEDDRGRRKLQGGEYKVMMKASWGISLEAAYRAGYKKAFDLGSTLTQPIIKFGADANTEAIPKDALKEGVETTTFARKSSLL